MPWMGAAQASSQESWASWPGASSGGWPSGVHSLTPEPRQISSLAIAKPKPPVSTHNRFDALSDNIGGDGKASTLKMTLGQVAKVVPHRPRGAKRASRISAAAGQDVIAPSAPVFSTNKIYMLRPLHLHRLHLLHRLRRHLGRPRVLQLLHLHVGLLRHRPLLPRYPHVRGGYAPFR